MKFTTAAFSALTLLSGTVLAVDTNPVGDGDNSNLRGRGLAGPPDGSGPPDGRGPPGSNTYDCDDGCGLDEVGHGPPVCGVDGNTYFNECLAYCQEVAIERPGACPGDRPINPNDDSYVRTGKVSKAEMDEFKAEKFKFVAKRKFPEGKLDLKERVGKGGPDEDKDNQRPTPPGLVRAKRVTRQGLEYIAEEYAELPDGYNPETNPSDGILGPNPQVPDEGLHRALSVLGVDTRTETTGFSWPNWRLGQLEQCNFWGCYEWCSGAIIGANSVLTNQHCTYDHDDQSWFVPEKFAPGRYNGGYDPWGTWNVRYATTFATSDWSYDVAVLTMESTGSGISYPIGQYMGTLGMQTQPCSFNEDSMRITGYPGDKPDKTMWTTGQCEDWSYSCGSRKIYHQCDTAGGMSGSAIRDQYNRITGVHSHGSGGGAWNSGMAFTSPVLSAVMQWAGLA